MAGNLTDQIAKKIEENIIRGVWKPGEYIPAMRMLAEQEGVSRGIITAAISILVGKGCLERIPRHGIKVCGADSKTDAKLLNATLAQKLATECADILKERAAINRNVPYQEDLEMLRQCFGPLLEGITEPMIPAERPEANTQAHIMLRAKGAFCAEWPEEQYTLYQCNLTKNSSQCLGGTLLDFQFAPENLTFDDRTREYQTCRVHPEDAANYLTLMNRARMLAESRTHECTHSLEYRELVGETHRWVRLSMYIEKRVKGADVILHLLFQNIDREKRETLRQQERSEEDALTGALSHRAFLLQANQLLSEKKEHVQHAFLLVEIKGFQEVSHTFGMEIGNSLLCDLVRSFRTMMRSEDLLGRIGLNRFLICLKDVPNDEVIRSRAKQLVRMVFGEYDNGITTTGSIGIAVFPRDGDSVDLLYSKLDAALTQVGTGGGEGFRFYQNQRVARHSAEHLMQLTFPELDASDIPSQSNATNRTRILVVDASEQNRSLLTAQLEDEYAVFQAENSRLALQLLRRYSQSISVVLLDLDLPGMSGLELLQTMQASTEIGSIPVLILSGADAAEHAIMRWSWARWTTCQSPRIHDCCASASETRSTGEKASISCSRITCCKCKAKPRRAIASLSRIPAPSPLSMTGKTRFLPMTA